jgi:hypothetical protein
MFTQEYNGAWIQGYCHHPVCYVTHDSDHFTGKSFKSVRAAKIAITKARNNSLAPSIGTKAWAKGEIS